MVCEAKSSWYCSLVFMSIFTVGIPAGTQEQGSDKKCSTLLGTCGMLDRPHASLMQVFLRKTLWPRLSRVLFIKTRCGTNV